MRGSRGVQNWITFFSFLADEGRKDPNTTISGHLRPASDTPFQWRFAGGPMKAQLTLNAGLVAL